MDEQPPTFRDFGILPEGLKPPPEKVAAFFSTGRIIGQYIGTALVLALGVGLVVISALLAPMPLSLLACAVTLVAFGVLVFRVIQFDFSQVELDGNVLRAKHLYTGGTIERRIDEISSLTTMTYAAGGLQGAVIESLLGRVRGIVVRFRDGRTPMSIMRTDPAMTNAQELIEAIVYRMSQEREVAAEVVEFKGQPLVRSIHWKDESPPPPRSNVVSVCLAVLLLLTLIFGILLPIIYGEAKETLALAAVPPQEISITSLIEKGPGTNRHITLTGFHPEGFVVESEKNGPWMQVWIALFPKDANHAEIKVVLSSKSARDVAALGRMMQGGRVTGICSATERTGWGGKLGPELVKANEGCELSSAWEIKEISDAPSEATVAWLLWGSVACLVSVLIMAAMLARRVD